MTAGKAILMYLLLVAVLSLATAAISMDKKRAKRDVENMVDLQVNSDFKRVKKDGATEESELSRVKRFKRNSMQRVKRQKPEEPPNPQLSEEPVLVRVKRGSLKPALDSIKRVKRNVNAQREPELERVKRAKRMAKETEPELDENALQRVKRFKRRTEELIESKPIRTKRTKREADATDKEAVAPAAAAAAAASVAKHPRKRMSTLPDRSKRHHMGGHKASVIAKAMEAVKNVKRFKANAMHKKKRSGGGKKVNFEKLKKDMLRLKRLKREINKDLHKSMKKLHRQKSTDAHKRVKRMKKENKLEGKQVLNKKQQQQS